MPRAAERVQRTLLERVHLLWGSAKGLADAVDDDGGRGAAAPRIARDGAGTGGCDAGSAACAITGTARMRDRLDDHARAYAASRYVALVALSLIVLTGAAVRLTGSGLGCPDWPRCYGSRRSRR